MDRPVHRKQNKALKIMGKSNSSDSSVEMTNIAKEVFFFCFCFVGGKHSFFLLSIRDYFFVPLQIIHK